MTGKTKPPSKPKAASKKDGAGRKAAPGHALPSEPVGLPVQARSSERKSDAMASAVHAVLHAPAHEAPHPHAKEPASAPLNADPLNGASAETTAIHEPLPSSAGLSAEPPIDDEGAAQVGQSADAIAEPTEPVLAAVEHARPSEKPPRDTRPAEPPRADPPQPDFDALSRTMAQLMTDSGRLASTYMADRTPVLRSHVQDAIKTLGQVAEHWFSDPARLFQAQTALTSQFFDLWSDSARRLGSREGGAQASSPPPADKRFSDPEWRSNPYFDLLHKGFLLGSQWMNELVDRTDGLDDATREKARFYVRQITSALSPSNFVPTNPELLRETLKENGANLVRGLHMMAEDMAAGQGQLRIRHTDASKFELGVNMAMTRGKVVFRNDLMELIQYSPTTSDVLARPILIVPPWINKFYVLDLNPEKSLIRWMVEQGLTVFLISWVQPDERHSAKDFESYMREGILAALDEIEAVTGQSDASAIGYCVGGTLLAVTLAHMAAVGDRRISSATLFTAQVDFANAGDLKVFADEAQIATLEGEMRQQGYLNGSEMARAFNMLRPEDLIWSFYVSNYLKGREPAPFDLLAWNADSTRMPAANHSFYLRNCYLENNLAKGLMEIAGQPLDLGRVTIPIYNMAAREDHIAPAVSVFAGSRFFGGPVRYVLAGSGHVAGVVNPPKKVKYGYTTGPEPVGSLDAWLEKAESHKGSWWPDWLAWLRAQAPATVPAREPGGGRPTLGDAPGTYVRVKA